MASDTNAQAQTEISPATYADLYAIDQHLEDIDAIATAYQESLCQASYNKRAKLAERIPGFWPLVFEQAPPDVDQFIQPSDSAVLAGCLTNFTVHRFEANSDPNAFLAALKNNDQVNEEEFGEPRSVSFRFEFKENEWFEDKVLEKKFWYRRSLEGTDDDAPMWVGRVSEPVKIHWKKGKDLSEGLTDAACALWEAQVRNGLFDTDNHEDAKAKDEATKKLPEYASLLKKVDNTTEGSQSFFTWFGYHGPWVSAARDAATRIVEKQRKKNPSKQDDSSVDKDDEDGEEEDLDEMPTHLAVEIFPDGEELALALAEDIWPNAIKYFLEAQEDDEEISEGSFDEADLEEMDLEDEGKANLEEIKGLTGRTKAGAKDAPPQKRRKT